MYSNPNGVGITNPRVSNNNNNNNNMYSNPNGNVITSPTISNNNMYSDANSKSLVQNTAGTTNTNNHINRNGNANFLAHNNNINNNFNIESDVKAFPGVIGHQTHHHRVSIFNKRKKVIDHEIVLNNNTSTQISPFGPSNPASNLGPSSPAHTILNHLPGTYDEFDGHTGEYIKTSSINPYPIKHPSEVDSTSNNVT